MKKIIFILLATLHLSAYAYDGSPTDQVEAFFKELPVNSDKAIDNLYASNPAMQQKAQGLTLMKAQIPQVAALFGSYIGYELISEEKISPSLVRVSVIEKRELHPLTWEFYFYKPKDRWIISQAMFGDQFQNLGSKK
jgi:hypothetical protein